MVRGLTGFLNHQSVEMEVHGEILVDGKQFLLNVASEFVSAAPRALALCSVYPADVANRVCQWVEELREAGLSVRFFVDTVDASHPDKPGSSDHVINRTDDRLAQASMCLRAFARDPSTPIPDACHASFVRTSAVWPIVRKRHPQAVEVCPGEADAFIAVAAAQRSAPVPKVVMSGDSDFLLTRGVDLVIPETSPRGITVRGGVAFAACFSRALVLDRLRLTEQGDTLASLAVLMGHECSQPFRDAVRAGVALATKAENRPGVSCACFLARRLRGRWVGDVLAAVMDLGERPGLAEALEATRMTLNNPAAVCEESRRRRAELAANGHMARLIAAVNEFGIATTWLQRALLRSKTPCAGAPAHLANLLAAEPAFEPALSPKTEVVETFRLAGPIRTDPASGSAPCEAFATTRRLRVAAYGAVGCTEPVPEMAPCRRGDGAWKLAVATPHADPLEVAIPRDATTPEARAAAVFSALYPGVEPVSLLEVRGAFRVAPFGWLVASLAAAALAAAFCLDADAPGGGAAEGVSALRMAEPTRGELRALVRLLFAHVAGWPTCAGLLASRRRGLLRPELVAAATPRDVHFVRLAAVVVSDAKACALAHGLNPGKDPAAPAEDDLGSAFLHFDAAAALVALRVARGDVSGVGLGPFFAGLAEAAVRAEDTYLPTLDPSLGE